jgi:hypothetical protein
MFCAQHMQRRVFERVIASRLKHEGEIKNHAVIIPSAARRLPLGEIGEV